MNIVDVYEVLTKDQKQKVRRALERKLLAAIEEAPVEIDLRIDLEELCCYEDCMDGVEKIINAKIKKTLADALCMPAEVAQ